MEFEDSCFVFVVTVLDLFLFLFFRLPFCTWWRPGLPGEDRPAGATAATLAGATTGAVTRARAVAAGAAAVAVATVAAVVVEVVVVEDARAARPLAVTAAGLRRPGTGAGTVRMMNTLMAGGIAAMMTGTIGGRGGRMRMMVGGGSRSVGGGRGKSRQ